MACDSSAGPATDCPAFFDAFVRGRSGVRFDDAAFAAGGAIVGRSLQIERVSHSGDRLERTRADVGSDVTLFHHA